MKDGSADHAIVLGGSIAGLLAARLLADAYDQVTVVDRDDLVPGGRPRPGAPQGRHIHGLLARGQQGHCSPAAARSSPGSCERCSIRVTPETSSGVPLRMSASGCQQSRPSRRALLTPSSLSPCLVLGSAIHSGLPVRP
jgi:hypothetical protein